MANVCGRCKRSMCSHDDHASCPQCRMAAGECTGNLDIENPAISVKDGHPNSGESSEGL